MLVTCRNVPGFPGFRVGNDGSVWSSWEIIHVPGKRGSAARIGSRWRPLKPLPARGGYHAVHLRAGGKVFRRLVHRLVLEAFVGPRPEGAQACHGDGDRTNNRLTNLRWGTPAENAADRDRHGTTARGERVGTAKLSDADVAELRRIGASGGNVRDAAARFGIHPEHAHRVARGRYRAIPTARRKGPCSS